MKSGDRLAFPYVDKHGGPQEGGLTKREFFAGIIMQKIARASLAPEALKGCAQIAVAHADALLAELERTGGGDK